MFFGYVSTNHLELYTVTNTQSNKIGRKTITISTQMFLQLTIANKYMIALLVKNR